MTRSAPIRFDRYWVAAVPLPAYFGLVTVLYGVLTWAFDALGNHRHATLDDLVLHVVLGSLFGAAMTAVVGFQRRRFGGSALQVATAKAVRSGVAPADADRDEWTPVLERRTAALRRSRWLSPVLVAPIVVFAVVVWVLAPRAAVPALWLIVISAVLVVLAEVQVARYLPRARAVLVTLHGREDRRAEHVERSAATDLQRPRRVLVALIACAIGVCAVARDLLAFVLSPGTVADVAHDVSADGHISLARVDQVATIAVAALCTYWSVLLLGLAVFGWFAFAGRNWARGWLVAIALLAMVELVSQKPTAIAIPVAAVVAVVLLYLPRSNAWFVARRPARRSA
jgi:hypothetical protein